MSKGQLLKALIILAISLLVMLLVRAAVATICCVEGDALQPVFLAGDRVLVNRWSYGLRVGGNRFMHYNRLWRRPVERGDIVAMNDPTDTLVTSVDDRRVLILRCKAIPGDKVSTPSTLHLTPSTQIIPGRYSCADMDYYLMEPVEPHQTSPKKEAYLRGTILIPEDHIIGRVSLIVYSHDPVRSILHGWRSGRFLAYP